MPDVSDSQGSARRKPRAISPLAALAAVGGPVSLATGALAWTLGGASHDPVSSLELGLAAGLVATMAGVAMTGRWRRGPSEAEDALAQAIQAVRENPDRDLPAQAADGALATDFKALVAQMRAPDKTLAASLESLRRKLAEQDAELERGRNDADTARRARIELAAAIRQAISGPFEGLVSLTDAMVVGGPPSRLRRFAQAAARSSDSLLTLVGEMTGQSAAPAPAPDAQPADPGEVVEDVLALFWERARARGLDLASFIDPTTPARIGADDGRLRRLLIRLVGAAVEAIDRGAVLVETAMQDGTLRIEVRADGAGASEGARGLAGAGRLAEALGGRLTASRGAGLALALDLPTRVLAPAERWPSLAGKVVRLELDGAASRASLGRYLRAAGALLAEPEAAEGSLALWAAEPARIKAAPRSPAAVLCLGDYGESAPRALVAAGLADLVLMRPLRRRDVAAALRQLALGQPLTDAAAPKPAGAAPFPGRRVLAADVRPVRRELILEALDRLGARATLVADGPAAMEAALAEPFDLILLGDGGPTLDPCAVAEEIARRQDAAGAGRTPMLTLCAQNDVAQGRWKTAGLAGAVGWPLTLPALAAGLAQVLAPAPASAAAQDSAGRAPTALTASLGPSAAADLLDPQVTGELARLAAAGKGDFVERVRRLYRDNAPAAVKALIEAATNRDCEATVQAAHALKSMSSNMGARLVAETAGRLEAQARDLKVVNVDQVQVLHRQLLATLDVLEGYPPALYPLAAADSAAPEEQALLADLTAALAGDELSLVYQPQFDREGETITGIETLLRWNHPTRGFVSPALFIPLAERYGLIGKITPWVLSRAMRETADLGDFTIGFNASAVEFADPAFVDELALLIARHDFDPRRLEIEVTETAVLAEEDGVRANMARLHELGLKIALDDFGVGYSSLSHLRLFPFDKLKIDRAFVIGCAENVQSATLVHAVVSIGRALGMKVIAEGVETEAQRKFLKVAGVHGMQGYLFAKPEPVEALKVRLAGIRSPKALSARSLSA